MRIKIEHKLIVEIGVNRMANICAFAFGFISFGWNCCSNIWFESLIKSDSKTFKISKIRMLSSFYLLFRCYHAMAHGFRVFICLLTCPRLVLHRCAAIGKSGKSSKNEKFKCRIQWRTSFDVQCILKDSQCPWLPKWSAWTFHISEFHLSLCISQLEWRECCVRPLSRQY